MDSPSFIAVGLFFSIFQIMTNKFILLFSSDNFINMKKFFSLLITATIIMGLNAQNKAYKIVLEPKKSANFAYNFYIDKIIDNRSELILGHLSSSINNSKIPIVIESDLKTSLENYVKSITPKKDSLNPITLIINEISLTEDLEDDIYTFKSLVNFSYQIKDRFITTTINRTNKSQESGIYHSINLEKSIIQSLNMLSDSLKSYDLQISQDTLLNEVQNNTAESKENKTNEYKFSERNYYSLGFGMGGFSFIGLDYEIRINDAFGYHLGFGIFGMSTGVRIHTNTLKKSSYFNVSFMDGGFGEIKTITLGWGGHIILSKYTQNSIHFHVGYSNVISKSNQLDNLYINGEKIKTFINFGAGIGF